ncbi:SpvB/TcaC N-terminal domain-containing protein [Actinoplanes sp. NPDC049265]|uniref:SpvB/TcaC N-terminal domain-containing protein n=1 Tax=Actinoplanes sp. NPDC049265 TaxID=3363902 RepID=UPI00371CC9F6
MPEIAAPGGQQIAGLGETFRPDTVTGAAEVTVSIFSAPARGAEPHLALRYTSGGGNGVFGLGFQLPMPSVTRRTELGVPMYAGDDTFVLDGGDILVPRYAPGGGAWQPVLRVAGLEGSSYRVAAFRRGVESTFDVIEWWTNVADPVDSFWIIVGSRNERTVLGRDPACRIADPADPGHVWRWLVEEQTDPHGNRTVYTYTGDEHAANRYLTRIDYGPYRDDAGLTKYAFAMHFDYGDRTGGAPASRPDPFSTFRAGFEIRTDRLCRAIRVTHHLPEELGPEPVTVSETTLDYEDAGVSLLSRITRTGRRDDGPDGAWTMSLPATTFGYTRWEPARTGLRDVAVRGAVPFDHGRVRFVDLNADGLPGVLTAAPGALLYARPLGGGAFAAPAVLPSAPTHRPGESRRAALLDITGTGRLDLVIAERTWGGFYANESTGWTAFEPFRAYTPELRDASARLVDLTGDGRPDLLSRWAGTWWVSRSAGTAGFAAPVPTAPPPGISALDGGGETVFTGFADVFGDGLSHLVRISDDGFEVWPSLGHGRFGDRRQVPGAPRAESVLTASHLLLADVDGDGADDLVCVRPGRVELYRNRFGRCFEPPVVHRLPDGLATADGVLMADLLGHGTAALVVSRAVGGGHSYLGYAGKTRPYLLCTIGTGTGATTQIEYRSSTEYSLADRAAGRPWSSTLPFPVPVVARVKSVDPASGSRLDRVFQYRDGYFDPVRRRFGGFGFVQSQDRPSDDRQTWHFPAAAGDTADEMTGEARLHRTWTHNGALPAGDPGMPHQAADELRRQDPGALVLPAARIEPAIVALGADAVDQAWQALAGEQYCGTEFGVGPAGRPGDVPYRVSQRTPSVCLIQPPLDGHPGVYRVVDWESARSEYGDDADDPRTEHWLNVGFDSFGHPLRTAMVAYPRRPAPGRERLPEQQNTQIHLRTAGVVNHVDGGYRNGLPLGVDVQDDGAGFHVVGLAVEETQYWLSGFSAPPSYLGHGQAADIVTASLSGDGDVLAHLTGCRRSVFWDDEQTGPLPLFRIGAHILPHHSRTAVLPDALVAEVYGDRVTDEILRQRCGYRHEDGCWWSWPQVIHYEDVGRHHLVRATEDPFGGMTTVEHDRYALALTSSTNALGHQVTAVTDYYALQPKRVVDINANVSEVLYDPLGRQLVLSHHGIRDGRLVGDDPLAGYSLIIGATVADVLADPLRFVQGAGAFTLADLEGEPARSVTVRRRHWHHPEEHDDVPDDQLAVEVSFLDGFLRPLGRADRETTGPAASWVYAAAVRYDDRGAPVHHYLPYRVSSPDFEISPAAPHRRTRYDAAGREVETRTPDGFLTRTRHHPWHVTLADENDTVLESPYYRAHADDPDLPAPEREALATAVRLRDTPAVHDSDVLGRTVRITDILVDPDGQNRRELREQQFLNARGDVVATADARFTTPDGIGPPRYHNTMSAHDLAGRVIALRSCDAGRAALDRPDAGVPTITLYDAAGAVTDSWDPRGYHVARHVDELRRLVRVHVTGDDLDQDTQLVRYGSDPGANTTGRVVQRFDQAGVVMCSAYALNGGPSVWARQYRADDRAEADWTDPAGVPLSPEIWAGGNRYDALGLPISTSGPAGVEVIHQRYDNGWTRAVAVRTSAGDTPIVTGVEYQPWGEPALVRHGNGTTVEYRFSETTQRLTAILARAGAEAPVLDVGYTHDPRGNVTRLTNRSALPGDAAPAVDGSGDYRYDSLYRLRTATGRAAAGSASPDGRATAATRPARYTERYEYDDAGNLTRTEHRGEAVQTRSIAVSMFANHGVPVEQARGRAPDNLFDAGGNLTELPNGARLSYDHLGRTTTARLEEATTRFQYDHTGKRVRRVTGDAETLYVDDLVVERSGSARMTVRVGIDGHLAALVDIEADGEPRVAAKRYQLTDRLGSVAYEMDDDGAILTCEEYLPFGGSALILGRPEATATKRYRFGGKERDQATGLYDHGRRYYLPGQGRWCTPDPAGQLDGLNLFAFARGNPVTLSDPTGLNGEKEKERKPTTVLKDISDATLAAHIAAEYRTYKNAETGSKGFIHAFRSLFTSSPHPFPSVSFLPRVGANTAVIGGLTSGGYYAHDMATHGATPANTLNLAGSVGFVVQGGMLFHSLILTGHAAHLAHQRIGVVNALVDAAKSAGAALEGEYRKAGVYTLLSSAGALTAMAGNRYVKWAASLGVSPATVLSAAAFAMIRSPAPEPRERLR